MFLVTFQLSEKYQNITFNINSHKQGRQTCNLTRIFFFLIPVTEKQQIGFAIGVSKTAIYFDGMLGMI